MKNRTPLLLTAVFLMVLIAGYQNPAPTVITDSWNHTEQGTVYIDAEGQPLTGWQEIQGSTYYFGEDTYLVTRWLELDDQRYYLGEDGRRATGWQEIDGHRYYFTHEGIMVTGWHDVGGTPRLFAPDGILVTGWLETESGVQYLDEDGRVTTGLVHLDTGSYYFKPEGGLHTGPLELDGKSYLFREDGSMFTGWYTEGEYDYYYLPDGPMATSPQVIDGKNHYFAPGGQHVVLVNPWNFLPSDLEVDLVTLSNGHQVDRTCYDALMQMLYACENAGFAPWVCSGHRTQEKQVALMENKIQNLMYSGYSREEAETLARNTVAFPGTSEHQLGLAVDIISDESKVLDYNQAKTQTQQWLMEHCWEFGFILRYPEDSTHITGIIYEPWHYRYVGLEISLEMRELGITLEEYLGAVSTEPLPEIEAVG